MGAIGAGIPIIEDGADVVHGSPAVRAIVSHTAQSLLLIECGTVWTRAWLLGQVEGRSRLLAAAQAITTSYPPRMDCAVGVGEAVSALEVITGQKLLTDGQVLLAKDRGHGIDGVTITLSMGGPLRILLGGFGIDWLPLVASATAVVTSVVRPQPALISEARAWFAPDTGWSPQLAPHVYILLGSSSEAASRPEKLAECAATVIASNDPPPHIILIGLPSEAAAVQTRIRHHAMTTISADTAVSPAVLAALLGQIYAETVLAEIPGFSTVRAWTGNAPLSTPNALGRVTHFLAQRYNARILTVDIGATCTTGVAAAPQGDVIIAHEALLGVRQGAGALLRRAGHEAVAHWLLSADEETVREATLERMLHPAMLPATPVDLAFDQALARVALRCISAPPSKIAQFGQLDVIIGTGGVLRHTARVAEAALLLLDGLQPTGISSLVIDAAGILGALGGAALMDGQIAADVADSDGLITQLGYCVSLSGSLPPGQPALQAILEFTDGRQYSARILTGTIERLPLGAGQRATLTLIPAAGVDIGLGPGQRATLDPPIEGGRLGVIIDARGRPIVLPEDPSRRAAMLRQWQVALEDH